MSGRGLNGTNTGMLTQYCLPSAHTYDAQERSGSNVSFPRQGNINNTSIAMYDLPSHVRTATTLHCCYIYTKYQIQLIQREGEGCHNTGQVLAVSGGQEVFLYVVTYTLSYLKYSYGLVV